MTVRDRFCGKIESITQPASAPGEATISFVKASAAKTALMLNGGSLDGNTLTVASSTGAKPGLAGEKVAVVTDHEEGEEVEQEGWSFLCVVLVMVLMS